MNDYRLGPKGLALIKHFETLQLKAYTATADELARNIWTIGYGHTQGVKRGDVCTEAQADAWLMEDCYDAERAVHILVKVPINQHQYDALVSFAFNVGGDIDADAIAEGLGDSTLLKKLNTGDYVGAALEFPKWNKQRGKVLQGLVRRRAQEQNLFSMPI